MPTNIEWTDETWNAIRARNRETGKVGWFCEKVAPECKNCYAENRNVNTFFGNGIRYAADQRDKIELFLDEKTLMQPLHWRAPREVFPCSMTDLFADFMLDEWIDRIYAVMALCPQHTFQVLTKRPGRRLAYLSTLAYSDNLGRRITAAAVELTGNVNSLVDADWPLPNVWEGVSAGNQEQADKLIPILLDTPAAVRWLSAEPLLGPVDISPFLARLQRQTPILNRHAEVVGVMRLSGGTAADIADVILDWIVVGGESGPGARSMNIAWARSIVQQCKAAGVPVFVKQLGAKPYLHVEGSREVSGPGYHIKTSHYELDTTITITDRKGGDITEFPADLQVREYPKVRA